MKSLHLLRLSVLLMLSGTVSIKAGEDTTPSMEGQPHPMITWKYDYNDGNLANTIGSAKNHDPVPLGTKYVGSGYSPAQIKKAYGFSSIGSTGQGKGVTIAIVDAYGSPSIQKDLNTFCTQFGLPTCTLHIIYPYGKPTPWNPSDPSAPGNGWAMETSMDVEWAHAIAPQATLLVIIVPIDELLPGAGYAANALHANIVSMSFGGPENDADTIFDTDYFQNPNTTFVASAGDFSGEVEYPACSPYVLAVGGTAITTTNSKILTETVWTENAPGESDFYATGGGTSQYEPEPWYQTNVQSSGFRTTPDVSFLADTYTGAAVYSSIPTYSGGWYVNGGTSLGAPVWAALLADRMSLGNQINNIHGLLYGAEDYDLIDTDFIKFNGWPLRAITNSEIGLFQFVNGVPNVTTNGGTVNPVTDGYDLNTGLGSPIADQIAYLQPGNTNPVPDSLHAVTLTLSGLTQTNGHTHAITVKTSVPKVATITYYNGVTNIPTAIGSYPVDVFVTQNGYAGWKEETLTILFDRYVTDTLNGKEVSILKTQYTSWLDSHIKQFMSNLTVIENKLAAASTSLMNDQAIKPTTPKVQAEMQGLSNTITTFNSQSNSTSAAITNWEAELTAWENSRQEQTISFPDLPYLLIGTAYQASSTSDLPVQLKVLSGPAEVTGTNVIPTGVGTITLVASQAGDYAYYAAPTITNSFATFKAQTLTPFPSIPPKTYGDPPFRIKLPEASSHLPVTTVASGSGTLTGDTLTLLGAGTVTLTATQTGDSTYAPVTNSTNFTVAGTNGSTN